MTRQQLKKRIINTSLLYILVIIIAIVLKIFDESKDQIVYGTLKDLIPLIFAIPLGYLGFCFNNRRAFIETKKKLWNLLVNVVNEATHSTYKLNLEESNYRNNLKNIGIAIDQIRATYKNVGEKDGKSGLYPFEPIKEIYEQYCEMGFGEIDEETREKIRDSILGNWKKIRKEFLHEFERYEPEHPVSKYIRK